MTSPRPEPRPDSDIPDCGTGCPVARAARVLDGKWTTLIVRELLPGPQRFAVLLRGIGEVSPRLLTARLRLLEAEGVVRRTVLPTQPPGTEYALTAHGQQLYDVIRAMAAFGTAAQQRDAEQALEARRQAEAAARTPARPRQVHRLR
jgi:DNA-binding HxlR family transcriptional regulator